MKNSAFVALKKYAGILFGLNKGFNGVYLSNMFEEAITQSSTISEILSDYTNNVEDWQSGLIHQFDDNNYYREIYCISKETHQKTVKIAVSVTKENDQYHITGYYTLAVLNDVEIPIDELVVLKDIKTGYRV